MPQHQQLDVLGGGRAAHQQEQPEHLLEDEIQQPYQHDGDHALRPATVDHRWSAACAGFWNPAGRATHKPATAPETTTYEGWLPLLLHLVDPRIDALVVALGDTEAHAGVLEMPLRKDDLLNNWLLHAWNIFSQAPQYECDIASQHVDR
jgi:hypothetical protein